MLCSFMFNAIQFEMQFSFQLHQMKDNSCNFQFHPYVFSTQNFTILTLAIFVDCRHFSAFFVFIFFQSNSLTFSDVPDSSCLVPSLYSDSMHSFLYPTQNLYSVKHIFTIPFKKVIYFLNRQFHDLNTHPRFTIK